MVKNQYLNLLKVVWESVGGRRLKFWLIYLMFVIGNVILMFQPYFLGQFLNVIQEGGENVVFNSAVYLGIYVALSFLFWGFHGPARVMERKLAFYICKNFSDKLFGIITKLPLKWHKDHHSGNTIDRVNRGVEALRSFMDEGYVYIESIIYFIASLTAILFIMRLDGLFILIFGFIVLIIIFRFDKVLTKNLREVNKRWHKVAAVFFDYVSNITTIITLRLQRLARNDFSRNFMSVFPVFKKNIVVNEVKWFVVDGVMMLSFFFVMIFYVYKTYSLGEGILAGNLVMLYSYMDKFIQVFYGLAWKYERLVLTATNLSSVNNIVDAYERLFSNRRVKHIADNWKTIRISDMNFKYEDNRHRVHQLRNVNLVLEKGLKIALVGESGGGKSTLMSLLRGLNMPDRVKMEVDGKSFKDLKPLANISALVPQDPEIFENTIRYNITLGIPATNREVMKIVRLACFDSVLAKLPSGLETNIREKGVNLSGGEKQRLALCRGIFASVDSDIILLDEPTSSVDSVNERKIYENILHYFRRKCVVSTIHRLHLLPMFDYIYVIHEGKIVEEGTFRGLLKGGSYLARQWKRYTKTTK